MRRRGHEGHPITTAGAQGDENAEDDSLRCARVAAHELRADRRARAEHVRGADAADHRLTDDLPNTLQPWRLARGCRWPRAARAERAHSNALAHAERIPCR